MRQIIVRGASHCTLAAILMELHYDLSRDGKARPQHDRHNSFLSHSYSAFNFPIIKTLSVLSKVIGHFIGYALLCTHTAGESKI